MTDGAESGPVPGGTITYPLLIACDSRGRILWMSAPTRTALDGVENLVQVSSAELKTGVPGEPPIPTLRFWRVPEKPGSLPVSAQPAEPATSITLLEVYELLHVQANIIRQYFRRQRASRSLAGRAQKKLPRGGTNAVRLIEMERQRLGRELHTGMGQMLAAIRLQVEIISRQLPGGPSNAVTQALYRIDALANDALEQGRSISKRLHPPEWQRLPLQTALQQLWEISGIPQRFEASLRIDPLPVEPDHDVKVLLYRAAQEAFANVARHSRATRVDATLETLDDRMVLSIEDNGVGFDAGGLLLAPANLASGIGLRSIRELAAALGGKLEVESGALGTKLVVSISNPPES